MTLPLSASRLWSLCLFLLLANTGFAAINASLDRSQVDWGESLNLILTATDGDRIGQPDLAALNHDFRVMGQSSSQNYQFINGKSSTTRTLTIQLMPRRSGELEIPSLTTAAGKTRPLTINISEPSQDPADRARSNLFMDADISPKEVYVGQQATITATLYYALDLNGGSLNNPDSPHASIAPLGKAQQFTRTIDQRDYRAYRQDFSIVPTEPGTLTLPGITFDGEKMVSASRNLFGMNVMGFSSSEPVSAVSDPIKLKVLPIPDHWQGLWLPAKKLTLDAHQPDNQTQPHIGDPIDITLTLSAIGLAAESLPDLTLPDIDGVSIYPDQTESHNSQMGGLIKGTKTRHFTLIPRQAGNITLPATTLNWFDTDARKQRTARIPAQQFKVAAAANDTTAAAKNRSRPATNSHQPPVNNDNPQADNPIAPATTAQGNPWKAAFFASLLIWLLVLLAWGYRTQRRARMPQPDTTRPGNAAAGKRRFILSVKQQNPRLLTDLLDWAKQDRTEITSLTQLKNALASDQARMIAALEHWRYAGGNDFPDGVRDCFGNGLIWQQTTQRPPPVPPLYPDDSDK